MPASFVRAMCGYRADGNPNTSDASNGHSKALGRELFKALGVPESQLDPGRVGAMLEQEVRADLARRRPDLAVGASTPLAHFAQYAHLAVFPRFRSARVGAGVAIEGLYAAIEQMAPGAEREVLRIEFARSAEQLNRQDELVDELLLTMPEESLLAVDITVGQRQPEPLLPIAHVALSAKWSLRTDRAQDCISQGAKMVAQRRGRMPHFAVITMEPRPYFLGILADGSGSIDCVYHLHLEALREAVKSLASQQRNPETWSATHTFDRLVQQGRLRDYDDLVREVEQLPHS